MEGSIHGLNSYVLLFIAVVFVLQVYQAVVCLSCVYIFDVLYSSRMGLFIFASDFWEGMV